MPGWDHTLEMSTGGGGGGGRTWMVTPVVFPIVPWMTTLVAALTEATVVGTDI